MPKKSKEPICNLYTANGVKNKNAAKFKLVATIRESQARNINDRMIEQFRFDEDDYNTFGQIYACAHLDKYLQENNKIPMMYTLATRVETVAKFELFTLYLYFTVDDEVKSRGEFLSRDINGKFSLELSIGDEVTVLDADIQNYPGNAGMQERMKEFALSDDIKALLPDIIESGRIKHKERMHKEHGFKFEYPDNKVPTPTITIAADLSREEIRKRVLEQMH